MKKLLLLSASMLLMALSVNAQRGGIWWFDVGLKVQGGGAGIFNKQVVDDPDHNYDLSFTSGSSFGGKIGINHDDHGLGIDVMYGKGGQPLEGPGIAGGPASTIETSWKAVELYTLYRNNRNNGYFEIGPKFSFIQSAEISTLNGEAPATQDISSEVASNVISGVMGFGAYMMGTDGRFSGVLGMRFEYGLTDLNGTSTSAPIGHNFNNAGVSSNIAFAGLVFELNWGLGYFGKATCGGRSKFISF